MLVRWEIDIDAETPLRAAQKALDIMQDKESIATHFIVFADYDRETESKGYSTSEDGGLIVDLLDETVQSRNTQWAQYRGAAS